MPHPPTFVLVLIGSAQGTGVVRDMAREICAGSPEIGWQPPQWLARGEVCEIAFSARDAGKAAEIRAMLANVYEREPVDICLMPFRGRRKQLLVADMESTIIEQEMLDELAAATGLGERISDITARAMRGDIEFEPALRERVALLAGTEVSLLERLLAERVTPMPGAETLVKTMRANGAYCALVSGGFSYFTTPVARRLGFDEHQANVIEIARGKLTGHVHAPILGREAKRAALERIASRLGLDTGETLAVGDGANDLDMIAAAGLGVAFRAKPKVRERAASLVNGAVITHGDLTALLYLQGYRKEEFHS